jgi:hypothetical protein
MDLVPVDMGLKAMDLRVMDLMNMRDVNMRVMVTKVMITSNMAMERTPSADMIPAGARPILITPNLMGTLRQRIGRIRTPLARTSGPGAA